MNLILHKAASILVYRYYNAQNAWFLSDYKDTSDIIDSRAVINRIIENIDDALEQGEGVLRDMRKDDLIDFRDNLIEKIKFVNNLCGVEEYADIILDDTGDTMYLYCTTDPHWDPIPMAWMTFLTPNDAYELGAGLRDLMIEYEAYRDAKLVTNNNISDVYEAMAYTTTTELSYDSDLASEIRYLSMKFYNQVTRIYMYGVNDELGYNADAYWHDTVSLWYEMDTIIDELSSKDELTDELKACIEELRFNRFSIQAENGMWISYKPDTNKSVINVAYGDDNHYYEIEVSSLMNDTGTTSSIDSDNPDNDE